MTTSAGSSTDSASSANSMPSRKAGAILVGDLLVEHRDERSREGALGEERPEHVRHSPSDGEGVGGEVRADELGEQHVADEAKHAACEGKPAG